MAGMAGAGTSFKAPEGKSSLSDSVSRDSGEFRYHFLLKMLSPKTPSEELLGWIGKVPFLGVGPHGDSFIFTLLDRADISLTKKLEILQACFGVVPDSREALEGKRFDSPLIFVLTCLPASLEKLSHLALVQEVLVESLLSYEIFRLSTGYESRSFPSPIKMDDLPLLEGRITETSFGALLSKKNLLTECVIRNQAKVPERRTVSLEFSIPTVATELRSLVSALVSVQDYSSLKQWLEQEIEDSVWIEALIAEDPIDHSTLFLQLMLEFLKVWPEEPSSMKKSVLNDLVNRVPPEHPAQTRRGFLWIKHFPFAHFISPKELWETYSSGFNGIPGLSVPRDGLERLNPSFLKDKDAKTAAKKIIKFSSTYALAEYLEHFLNGSSHRNRKTDDFFLGILESFLKDSLMDERSLLLLLSAIRSEKFLDPLLKDRIHVWLGDALKKGYQNFFWYLWAISENEALLRESPDLSVNPLIIQALTHPSFRESAAASLFFRFEFDAAFFVGLGHREETYLVQQSEELGVQKIEKIDSESVDIIRYFGIPKPFAHALKESAVLSPLYVALHYYREERDENSTSTVNYLALLFLMDFEKKRILSSSERNPSTFAVHLLTWLESDIREREMCSDFLSLKSGANPVVVTLLDAIHTLQQQTLNLIYADRLPRGESRYATFGLTRSLDARSGGAGGASGEEEVEKKDLLDSPSKGADILPGGGPWASIRKGEIDKLYEWLSSKTRLERIEILTASSIEDETTPFYQLIFLFFESSFRSRGEAPFSAPFIFLSSPQQKKVLELVEMIPVSHVVWRQQGLSIHPFIYVTTTQTPKGLLSAWAEMMSRLDKKFNLATSGPLSPVLTMRNIHEQLKGYGEIFDHATIDFSSFDVSALVKIIAERGRLYTFYGLMQERIKWKPFSLVEGEQIWTAFFDRVLADIRSARDSVARESYKTALALMIFLQFYTDCPFKVPREKSVTILHLLLQSREFLMPFYRFLLDAEHRSEVRELFFHPNELNEIPLVLALNHPMLYQTSLQWLMGSQKAIVGEKKWLEYSPFYKVVAGVLQLNERDKTRVNLPINMLMSLADHELNRLTGIFRGSRGTFSFESVQLSLLQTLILQIQEGLKVGPKETLTLRKVLHGRLIRLFDQTKTYLDEILSLLKGVPETVSAADRMAEELLEEEAKRDQASKAQKKSKKSKKAKKKKKDLESSKRTVESTALAAEPEPAPEPMVVREPEVVQASQSQLSVEAAEAAEAALRGLPRAESPTVPAVSVLETGAAVSDRDDSLNERESVGSFPSPGGAVFSESSMSMLSPESSASSTGSGHAGAGGPGSAATPEAGPEPFRVLGFHQAPREEKEKVEARLWSEDSHVREIMSRLIRYFPSLSIFVTGSWLNVNRLKPADLDLLIFLEARSLNLEVFKIQQKLSQFYTDVQYLGSDDGDVSERYRQLTFVSTVKGESMKVELSLHPLSAHQYASGEDRLTQTLAQFSLRAVVAQYIFYQWRAEKEASLLYAIGDPRWFHIRKDPFLELKGLWEVGFSPKQYARILSEVALLFKEIALRNPELRVSEDTILFEDRLRTLWYRMTQRSPETMTLDEKILSKAQSYVLTHYYPKQPESSRQRIALFFIEMDLKSREPRPPAKTATVILSGRGAFLPISPQSVN